MLNEMIKFNTETIKKRDFFTFITKTLENNGWESVASNPVNEGIIYQSKGLDGKQSILVNIWDGHELNPAYKFTTTHHPYIDIRMLIDYTPSVTSGVNGISTPIHRASNFIRWRVNVFDAYIYPDYKFTIRYHCNANRMIMFVTGMESTSVLMFGKPSKYLSKEYENTGNMIFTTYSYKFDNITSWGVADRNATGTIAHTPIFINTGKSMYNGKIKMSEIGFGNNIEGVKGFLEGVYLLTLGTTQSPIAPMTGDKIIDEVGNEFTLLHMRATDSSTYPSVFPVCHVAICTKKAGED